MNQKVEQCVILMAGKGTRFLPATRAVAKELFPIGNKPVLLFHMIEALKEWYSIFTELPAENRVLRHIANVNKGSAAKRINMYLRWMVRQDGEVDFGLWHHIPPSALLIPLDLHTGNTSRQLGLLNRKQNDCKAVIELTTRLREFDPEDPIRYDFALFGLGAFERQSSTPDFPRF